MSEIEPYQPRKRPIALILALCLVLVFGVAIGVLIAPKYFEGQPSDLANRMLAQGDEKPSESEPGELDRTPVEPSDEKGANSETKSPTDPETKANPAPNPDTKANPATISGPNPLEGNLPGGPVPSGVGPVNPIVIESPDARTPTTTYVEYMVIVPEADVAPMVQRVAGVIRSAGGQVQLQFTHDPEHPELGQDFVVAIDSASVSKLSTQLRSIDAAQESDQWAGPLEDRQLRAQRFLREAVDQLERRIRELKVRFLDDAPEIVRLSETCDRYRQGLHAFRKVPAGKEVFRIYVGKSLPAWG